ncbi:MAG: hypothetical protein KKF68_00460 [Nanoarchaeota archaeon]|nr:hypothetical protein [Nanoarchaeota archaeon]
MKKRRGDRISTCLPLIQTRGQVWVETVIYTLIGFMIIGAVLSVAKPKIEEIRDKTVIEQSRGILEDINMILISIVQGGAGNKRVIELGVRKGSLEIDGVSDKLIFEIDNSRYTYSQPGENITSGSVIINTEKIGEYNVITLTSNYGGKYNITYNGKDELKTLSKASTPYKIFISNKGKINNKTNIDIVIN